MGYFIAENIVKDPAAFTKDAAPQIGKMIENAGGKFLMRGGKTITMHGAPVVVLRIRER